MKTRTLILILVSVFFGVAALATIVFYTVNKPIEKRSVYAEMTISEGNLIGFNVNNTGLYFGRIPLKGAGKKNIIITNTYPFKVRIESYGEGNITPFLSISPATAILSPDEFVNISVFVRPESGEYTLYDGHVLFVFYRVMPFSARP